MEEILMKSIAEMETGLMRIILMLININEMEAEMMKNIGEMEAGVMKIF